MGKKLGERSGYVLTVMFAVMLLMSFDRNIAGVVAEPIRKEFGLQDAEVGLIAAAFLGFYAIAGVPIGRLVDRGVRTKILAVAVLAWSVFTSGAGFARSYVQLVLMRIGVGVGEATSLPATMSLLGDMFPPTRRSRATSIVMTGLPLGAAMAFGLGGVVAKNAGWRASFFIAFVPGIVASLGALLLAEPKRGAAEEHAIGAKHRPGSFVKIILTNPTVWVVNTAGAILTFAMFSAATFTAPLLMRYCALPIDKVGGLLAIQLGIAPLFGLVVGGVLTDRIRKTRADAPLLVAGILLAISSPMTLLSLSRAPNQVGALVAFMALGLATMFPLVSLAQVALQEVLEPSLRGAATGIFGVTSSIVGALGPLVTGGVSDHYTREAAIAAGVTATDNAALEPFRAAGIHAAMYVLPISSALIAVLLLSSLARARKDASALKAWMAEQAVAEPT